MDLIYPQHFTVRSSPECAVVSSKLLEKIIEQDIPELTVPDVLTRRDHVLTLSTLKA